MALPYPGLEAINSLEAERGRDSQGGGGGGGDEDLLVVVVDPVNRTKREWENRAGVTLSPPLHMMHMMHMIHLAQVGKYLGIQNY